MSKILVLYEGHVKINLYRDALFVDEPCPENAHPVASAIKYGELWGEEIKKRWKKTTVTIETAPGLTPPLVSVSDDHINQDAVMRDVLRLGIELYNRRPEWLVRKGSPEHRRIAEEVQAKLDNNDGSNIRYMDDPHDAV